MVSKRALQLLSLIRLQKISTSPTSENWRTLDNRPAAQAYNRHGIALSRIHVNYSLENRLFGSTASGDGSFRCLNRQSLTRFPRVLSTISGQLVVCLSSVLLELQFIIVARQPRNAPHSPLPPKWRRSELPCNVSARKVSARQREDPGRRRKVRTAKLLSSRSRNQEPGEKFYTPSRHSVLFQKT